MDVQGTDIRHYKDMGQDKQAGELKYTCASPFLLRHLQNKFAVSHALLYDHKRTAWLISPSATPLALKSGKLHHSHARWAVPGIWDCS